MANERITQEKLRNWWLEKPTFSLSRSADFEATRKAMDAFGLDWINIQVAPPEYQPANGNEVRLWIYNSSKFEDDPGDLSVFWRIADAVTKRREDLEKRKEEYNQRRRSNSLIPDFQTAMAQDLYDFTHDLARSERDVRGKSQNPRYPAVYHAA